MGDQNVKRLKILVHFNYKTKQIDYLFGEGSIKIKTHHRKMLKRSIDNMKTKPQKQNVKKKNNLEHASNLKNKNTAKEISETSISDNHIHFRNNIKNFI